MSQKLVTFARDDYLIRYAFVDQLGRNVLCYNISAMEDFIRHTDSPENEPPLDSIRLLEAIDISLREEINSEYKWLAGELDDQTRELMKPLDLEDALGHIYTIILEAGGDPDACLAALGILETSQ